MIQKPCSTIAKSTYFQSFIIFVIVCAGVLVGLETYPSFTENRAELIHFANNLIIAIFTIEILIKFGTEGTHFWRFFKDPWNVFDFTIVVVCFLPLEAQFVAVLRLARILRVLRLVSVIPKLQILIVALLKSIPSMFYVSILLMIIFYVYAVLGTFLFGANDPVHFGSLGLSMLSLFRVVTLEDWTDIMYIQMYGSDVYAYSNPESLAVIPTASPIVSVIFFVSFVLIGTMIVLNLFIGIIMNSMDEARQEEDIRKKSEMRKEDKISLTDEIDIIKNELDTLQGHLSIIQSRLKHESSIDMNFEKEKG